MIGLDTNVLVRYVTQDDPVQSAKASSLIESFTALHRGLSAWFRWWSWCGYYKAATNAPRRKWWRFWKPCCAPVS